MSHSQEQNFMKINTSVLMKNMAIIFISLFSATSICSETLTVIIPFGPGGGSHQFATTVLKEVAKTTELSIKIINIQGNSGLKGTKHYMTLPPDGKTILQQVDILPSMFAAGKTTIDPSKDLVPVSGPQIVYSQLYIRNIDLRFHEWKSFFAYNNNHPEKLKISTIGSSNSLEKISMRLLSMQTGLDTKQINFDDPAKRYMSLVEGKVDALLEQPGDVAPFLKRKLIIPILTFLEERPSAFPVARSLNDIGTTFKPLLRFRSFFVNSSVPNEKIEELTYLFNKAYQSSSVREYFEQKYSLNAGKYERAQGTSILVRETIETYKQHQVGERQKI